MTDNQTDNLQQTTNNESKHEDIDYPMKAQEYLDNWKRERADFLNYKKDELRRFEEIARYGSEELMEELIRVVDSFDLGIVALEKAGPVEKGIYMIRVQLEDVLKRRGLEKISVRPGEVFDPTIHEAVGETESDHPPGAIVEQIEPGYKLYDKILRVAQVKVGKS